MSVAPVTLTRHTSMGLNVVFGEPSLVPESITTIDKIITIAYVDMRDFRYQ